MNEVEKMNEAMYERLGEIVFKAANTRTIFNGASGAEEKNLQLLAAFKELRQMCEFYKPGEHQNANLRQSDESTRMPQGQVREDSPNSPDSRSEAKKLEASVARQREVLTQIADLALAAEAKSGNANVRLGSKFMDNSKAICAIRQLCGPSLVEKLQTQEPIREDSPNSPDSRSEAELTPEEQSAIQREEARQKRKIHWTAYPTKVDVCVMGKTEQNGKVYEVRISKRTAEVTNTYWETKVNGHRVFQGWFEGSAWMAKRMLTAAMQALVNYKAKRNRDSRRNFAKRAAAAKQQAHDNKGSAATHS